MTLKDDLIAAKALIDTPEKWRKDDRDFYDECCCAAIACHRVSRRGRIGIVAGEAEDAMLQSLYDALDDEWRTVHGEPGVYVGHYNDAPDTTHADIMALFDRAIEAAP